MQDDFLAARYGWTVQQIDATPLDRLQAMITIAEVRAEIERDQTRTAGG